MSRVRNTEYNTVHHLTSRIAHGVHLLDDDARNDFLSIAKRVSAFSGVELIGWCVMNNHFHIYAYLPVPPPLSDEEVLRRFHALKGDVETLSRLGAEGRTFRANFDEAQTLARSELVRAIRRRMYSIAEYMRIVKQWFSEEYNMRTGHKGTMWQSIYGDNPFFLPERPEDYTDLRDILAYIHLNPVRATITDRFDGYAWSSYAAYRKGEPDAVRAMRFAYRGYEDDEEIVKAHEERMSRLLKEWQRKRAEEIVRRRAEGHEMPTDALTSESLVREAEEHAAEIQRELERLHAARDLVKGVRERREAICREIVCVRKLHPDFKAGEIAELIDAPVRTVQRYLAQLKAA